jgi:hypothetical protein
MGRPGGFWEQAEQFRTMNDMVGNHKGVSTMAMSKAEVVSGPIGYATDELEDAIVLASRRAQNAMRWNRTALEDAQLIHVSADLCDVLFSAHDSVPDDVVLTEAMMPTPYGLAVFQTPFHGIDSGSEYKFVRVDAVMWGPVMLPPRDAPLTDQAGVPGVAVAAFRMMDPINHDDPAARRLRAEIEADGGVAQMGWLPLGRSDWVIGDPLTTPTHALIDPDSDTHRSMVEDRRLIAALWSLIQQKRVVERTTVTADRAARRRLDRAGDRTSREVEVIHLRRPEYRPRNDDGTTERRYHVRWAVRPHWRNQAWGPGRKLRRLILVPPHMKGDPDAPLKHVERVWSLDQ